MELPLLPTTMVGSYPRPAWFRHQLEGRDVLEAWKLAAHAEAFDDAVRVVIDDQERAGLDVVTDGQMWFDDYQMGIRLLPLVLARAHRGFGREKPRHPARGKATGADAFVLDEAGGVAVRGPIARGPIPMGESTTGVGAHDPSAQSLRRRRSDPTVDPRAFRVRSDPRSLCPLARPRRRVPRRDRGASRMQAARTSSLEDLGAWIPNLSGDKDFAWVREVVDLTLAGVRASRGTARTFRPWQRVGQHSPRDDRRRPIRAKILGRYADLESVDEFVLDYCLPRDGRHRGHRLVSLGDASPSAPSTSARSRSSRPIKSSTAQGPRGDLRRPGDAHHGLWNSSPATRRCRQARLAEAKRPGGSARSRRMSQLEIVGRSSSHFTRTARFFAIELGVLHSFRRRSSTSRPSTPAPTRTTPRSEDPLHGAGER